MANNDKHTFSVVIFFFGGCHDFGGEFGNNIRLVGTLSVRRVGRYEVVTYQNATVPDVVVHAAADTERTSLFRHRPAECFTDHVTCDEVTPPRLQSPDAAELRPPTSHVDERKLPTREGGALSSSSLPQLSGRQHAALDGAGSNNVSLGALHAAAYVDAALQRQTLIRSRACRPCHDLSKVTRDLSKVAVDRPRFGSHFRLSATVADMASSCDNHDRSSLLLQNVVVCDSAQHNAEKDRVSAVDMTHPQDQGPPTARLTAVDREAMSGRTLASRGGLAVMGGVRACRSMITRSGLWK